MKKFAASCFALVLALSMAGCAEQSLKFDIGEAGRIELRSGTDGTAVEITDTEDIKQITDGINALTFRKGGSSKDHSGWSYSLKWYDPEGTLMEEIVVMSGQQIDHNGYFYSSTEAGREIDLAYFDSLLGEG